jgi:hypothetical protein
LLLAYFHHQAVQAIYSPSIHLYFSLLNTKHNDGINNSYTLNTLIFHKCLVENDKTISETNKYRIIPNTAAAFDQLQNDSITCIVLGL